MIFCVLLIIYMIVCVSVRVFVCVMILYIVCVFGCVCLVSVC